MFWRKEGKLAHFSTHTEKVPGAVLGVCGKSKRKERCLTQFLMLDKQGRQVPLSCLVSADAVRGDGPGPKLLYHLAEVGRDGGGGGGGTWISGYRHTDFRKICTQHIHQYV